MILFYLLKMENNNDEFLYVLSNDDTCFIVIRDITVINKISDIINKSKAKYLTIVFDFENLSKEINDKDDKGKDWYFEFKQIVYNNIENANNNNNLNLVFKNTLIRYKNMYFDNEILKLNQLYITDELYTISPDLDTLFKNFKTNILVLKKFKINSKLQLQKFLTFIKETGCEILTLEDIYIELIIKEDEYDKKYNKLEQYISFQNDDKNQKIIFIKNKDGKNIKTNIKN